MQLTEEILIARPVRIVWDLFDEPNNLKKWQSTLEQYEHLRGNPGQPGARAELTYNENGRIIKMIETIDRRVEQRELSGTYEVENVTQKMTVRFEDVDMGKVTKVTFETDVSLTGPLRLLVPLMKTGIRNRVRTHLEAFKTFVELEN